MGGRRSFVLERSSAASARASRIWLAAIEKRTATAEPPVSQNAARDKAGSKRIIADLPQNGKPHQYARTILRTVLDCLL